MALDPCNRDALRASQASRERIAMVMVPSIQHDCIDRELQLWARESRTTNFLVGKYVKYRSMGTSPLLCAERVKT